MMQVEGEAPRSRPAQAAQETATTRPPQPQTGQRHDQHACTDPADNLATTVFRDCQIFVKHVQKAEERRSKFHHVQDRRCWWVKEHRYDARPDTSVTTMPAHGDAHGPTRVGIAYDTGAQISWIFRDGFR